MSFSGARRAVREGPRRRSPARVAAAHEDARSPGGSSKKAACRRNAAAGADRPPRAAYGLKPMVTLRGPMALARERSDHVRADLEARVEQNVELRQRNADLAAKNAAKDHLLNRQRDAYERAKAHNAALRVQIKELQADLLAANAHAQSLSRVHEDAMEDHAGERYAWEEERRQHDAAANAAREVRDQLEQREETARMQAPMMPCGERDDLAGVIKKPHEVSVLRHVPRKRISMWRCWSKRRTARSGALQPEEDEPQD